MMFILSLSFTDQGIRGIKDAPKRVQAARELAKKVGVEIKQIYLTSGESDLLVMLETTNGDNVAKFALALGMQCNAPKPQTNSVQLMPTTSRPGNCSASVVSAARSLGSLKVGTSTSPLAM